MLTRSVSALQLNDLDSYRPLGQVTATLSIEISLPIREARSCGAPKGRLLRSPLVASEKNILGYTPEIFYKDIIH